MHKIKFTKHANLKFDILKKYNFVISKKFVAKAVRRPELRDDTSRKPLRIVIKEIDEKHYLRVIYKEEGNTKKIITFYPTKKGRYESKLQS